MNQSSVFVAALLLSSMLWAAADRENTAVAPTAPADVAGSSAFQAAIVPILAGDWRSPQNSARDIYRHPAQTLGFLGVIPDATVIEISPGTGWYSEILSPLIGWHGIYEAAVPATASGHESDSNQKLRDRFASDPKHFAAASIIEFDPKAPVLGKPASVDVVLTFRNVHNWVKDGTEKAYFKAFYDVLRPGGVLGIEDHRAKTGTPLDINSGYLPEDYVIKLATDAGFRLNGSSEINANPNDTKDYPKGVWTLPPTFALGEQDKAKYLAIGESDRFTLRFIKVDAQQQEAEVAIRHAINDWDAGWRTFNADLVSHDYADDADWINAFGEKRKGREQIRAYLAHGFTSPEWLSRHSTPSTVSIRFITPDVAVVNSSRQTIGQKTASGQLFPTRLTHDLRVFVHQNGRWEIVSHEIMDEKEVHS